VSTVDFSLVYRWFNFAQFWLLPPACVLCQASGQLELDLCLGCAAKLPRLGNRCQGCALPLPVEAAGLRCGACLLSHDGIHRTVALGGYAPPLSDLITRFKYQRGLEAGRVLAGLLAAELSQHYRDDEWPHLLVPIPLHSSRLSQRGYNQAALLATDLGKALRLPVAMRAIRRERATPTQQGLSARERRRNLRGAFVVSAPWQHSSAQRIALIDDVVTTISTVREVASELRRCIEPAPEIHVWCLARA
jgi:ComF family protein